MTKRDVAVLLLASLVLAGGCRTPLAGSPPPAVSPSEPSPAASSLNPLGGLERSLVFFPARYPRGIGSRRASTSRTPGSPPPTAPAARLVRAARAAAGRVLFCHGNGGNVALWADVLRILHDRMGVTRDGDSTTAATAAAKGSPARRACWPTPAPPARWLARRAGIAENQIVLMGRSLGGAVAVDLAAADGARGLVLESTFTSMPDVGQAMYPLLPVRALMQTQFNSAGQDRQLSRPAVAKPRHGRPARSPTPIGRRLFAAANQPKRFIAIPGGDHNDPQTGEYYAALASFLDGLE